MRRWKIRAVRSVLVFVVAIGIGMHVPSAMCDRHFLLGTDHRRIVIFVDSSITKTNRWYNSTSIVYTAALVQNILIVVGTDCCVCPTLLTDRS